MSKIKEITMNTNMASAGLGLSLGGLAYCGLSALISLYDKELLPVAMYTAGFSGSLFTGIKCILYCNKQEENLEKEVSTLEKNTIKEVELEKIISKSEENKKEEELKMSGITWGDIYSRQSPELKILVPEDSRFDIKTSVLCVSEKNVDAPLAKSLINLTKCYHFHMSKLLYHNKTVKLFYKKTPKDEMHVESVYLICQEFSQTILEMDQDKPVFDLSYIANSNIVDYIYHGER